MRQKPLLKGLEKNGKEVVLEAENKNYKSQVYKSGSNIKIQGYIIRFN